MVDCFDRSGSIRAKHLVPAIVQQNHVAAPDFWRDLLLDEFSAVRIPIVSSDVPHHRLQPEFAHNSECSRPSAAPGGAKQIRVLPDGIMECIAALLNFITHVLSRCEDQQRMCEGVVPNHVPALCDFQSNIWPLAYVFSNQEKCCFNVVPR